MLDGINAILQSFGILWNSWFNLPLYGPVTLGYFVLAATILSIIISFFIARLK